MSKITPRDTNTVENETQLMFVCVCDNAIGIVLRDKETFQCLDFFELDLCLKATALYIDDFDELLAFANNNDKACIRTQIPPSENTDNKTDSLPFSVHSVGVVASEGEALFSDLSTQEIHAILKALIFRNDYLYRNCLAGFNESHFKQYTTLQKLIPKIQEFYQSLNDDIPPSFEGA